MRVVPHLPVLLAASVDAQARFRRILAVTLTFVRLHRRGWPCGSLSGRLGKRRRIHFVVVGAAEFDLQS